jgi:hypothetical protein
MENFKEQINKIATDLLNLEINTIVKPNIEGNKMPSPRHALLEIAKVFDYELTRQGISRLENHRDFGGRESFDQLRERADRRALELQKRSSTLTAQEGSDLLMLYRVRDKSDLIKGLFNDLERKGVSTWDNEYSHLEIEEKQPPFPLSPSQLVLIRKIWELGVEEIALQTIIQMDGDVVTRVQPKYISSGNEVIFKMHNQGVATCISFWKELIGIVKDFFSSIVKMFF